MDYFMERFLEIFQGFAVIANSDWKVTLVRCLLVIFGVALVWLGRKGILEALVMIPMGLGMATVNVAGMMFDPLKLAEKGQAAQPIINNLFLDSTISNNDQLMTLMQIDWLQPIYTLGFSNGLIPCLIFIGIGALIDVGFIMRHPYVSATVALFAELGTLLTLPLAVMWGGYSLKEAASIALVGGADGPMVLFLSLKMAEDLFVPITVVAYMYLALAYAVFPHMVRLTIPKRLRGINMPADKKNANFSSGQKIAFAVFACVLLCFLFPVAAPLLFALFIGIVIRESGMEKFKYLVNEIILYIATLTLGILLGTLCEAQTIMNPKVLPLLVFGMMALMLSGVGGIIGGYFMYFVSGKKFNPVIGIAAVSCVPTTVKVAQKCAAEANPNAIIMHYAIGANFFGIITTAIIAALYISILQ